MYVSGDRIGDALLKYPTLRAFRAAHPETHVSWATGRRPSVFAGRLKGLADGLIDCIQEQVFPTASSFLRLSKAFAGAYEVVVCTESRLRDALALKRIAHDRFVSPAAGFLLSSHAAPENYQAGSVAERFESLMSQAGGFALDPVRRIDVPDGLRQWAAQLLPPPVRYVGLSPGAGGVRKRWPLKSFIELAGALIVKGYRPVFFLGPSETNLASEIAPLIQGARFPEIEESRVTAITPLHTIALAQRMCFSVTNDSGGGHLIAAGAQPVVTLFGHTSAEKFASPYCQQIAVCSADIGFRTLAELPVSKVLEVIERAEPVVKADYLATPTRVPGRRGPRG